MGTVLTRLALSLALLVVALGSHATAQEGGDRGTISGVVLDKSTGDPVIDAGVEIVGTPQKTRTDLDGKYAFKLPPGTYTVRVYAAGYQSVRIDRLQVTPGAVSTGDAALPAAGEAGVEVVEVVAEAAKAAEATQMIKRKAAPVVSETISAEVIKKTPGSDAAAVVKRVPSVTVRDDFVFVRGLGERYTTARLNGSRLPSPDPLRRVVPLDLFPAAFLESISIAKTFTPDLPGDFSGGLVDLRLHEFPDELTYSLNMGTGVNTQTTGQDFLTYKSTALDNVASGASSRQPPASIPAQAEQRDLPFSTARQFENIWSPETSTAPPDFDLGFSVGNTWGPFGFQFGGLLDNEWRTQRQVIKRQFTNAGTPDDPDILIADDFKANQSVFSARLAGVLTTAYKINDDHRLGLNTFINQNADDLTRRERGETFQGGAGSLSRQTALQYVQDQLAYVQLLGEHQLPWLRADWRSVISRSTRQEPDTRYTTYSAADPGQPLLFTEDSLGGERINNDTLERLTDNQADFTVPFQTRLPGTTAWRLPAKFKFGPSYSYRRRDFQQRRFQFIPNGATQNLQLPAEDLFEPDAIGPAGASARENSNPSDDFTGSHEIIAGYGMFELPIFKDTLRFIGGVRTEYSYIRLDEDVIRQGCPGGASRCLSRFIKNNLNPLPGINTVFSPRPDMNFRVGWSRSVSRPELRELAVAQFPAQRGDRPTFGNPDLIQADIESFDFRWEWFFSPLELASLSYFYKTLENPIEQAIVLQGSAPANTWINAKNADIIGWELEARKNFGFVRPLLEQLTFYFNFTWSDSTSNVGKPRVFGIQTSQTSATRQLQGQAPFILNTALEWNQPDWVTARLLYYTQQNTLDNAGINGLPDIFLDRRDQLDFVVQVPLQRWVEQPITAKLSVENILNDPWVWSQGGLTQQRYTDGVSFGIGFTLTR
jgi:TonB-dependent receptor